MILTFQYLRAVAALLVVIFHLKTQVLRLGYEGYWPDWAFVGVDLFFVLSGYLMWAITAKRHQSPGAFLWRRFIRVVPLYWIITTAVVAVMLLAPHLMVTGRFIFSHVLGSYIFVGMPNSSGWLYPVINVGWTLNLEMLFYVIFALSLLLPVFYRLAAIMLAFSLIVASGYLFSQENIWAKQYTSSILFEFVFGIFIAQAHLTGRLKFIGRPISWVLVGGGFAWIAYVNPSAHAGFRALFIGLPAAAIVTGF